MKIHGITPILNVSNIVESFEWFAKLGWEKAWDWGDPPSFGAFFFRPKQGSVSFASTLEIKFLAVEFRADIASTH